MTTVAEINLKYMCFPKTMYKFLELVNLNHHYFLIE